jgi:nucleoside-diphosphate-sugar epimerase
MASRPRKIFVTGGAGYVGCVLVPRLLARGHSVKVIDWYIYGEEGLAPARGHPKLVEVRGDIRDRALLEREIPGCDTVIHLACISNDPSYELDPDLGRSINYDAFLGLIDVSRKAGVGNFIYASSSSVYGVKEEPEVTEDLPLEPLTDYSRYKALCEDVALAEATKDFVVTIVRPATVCGYSPRLRLDLTVNILTNHAVNKGKLTVFGGDQYRPNLHIEDMAELYCFLLEQPDEKIRSRVWNVGYENYTVMQIARMVQKAVSPSLPIEVIPTDDHRSYRVCSKKIKEDLGFEPHHTIEDAIHGLRRAFVAGKVPEALTAERYYNVKTMQARKVA